MYQVVLAVALCFMRTSPSPARVKTLQVAQREVTLPLRAPVRGVKVLAPVKTRRAVGRAVMRKREITTHLELKVVRKCLFNFGIDTLCFNNPFFILQSHG